MSKKLQRLCWRGFLFCVGMSAFLVVMVTIALGIFLVALRAGPVSVNFAKGYIQEKLYNENNGAYGQFDNVTLSWPVFDGPFILGLDHGRVMRQVHDADDFEIVSVDSAELGVSKSGLFLGRVKPVSLIVGGLELDVVRNGHGEFDFGFGDIKFEAESRSDSMISVEQDSFLTRVLGYIGGGHDGVGNESSSSLLRYLELLHIKNAQIHFSDRLSGLSMDFVNSDVVFESQDEGVKAELDLFLDHHTQDLAQRGRLNAEVHVSRPMKKMAVVVQAEQFDLDMLLPYLSSYSALSTVLEKQSVVLDAQVKTVLDENFNPEEIEYAVMSRAGAVQLDYISDNSIAYQDFALSGVYDHYKGMLQVTKGTLSAHGAVFDLSANILRQGQNGAYIGPVILQVQELQQDKLALFWPQGLDEAVARKWLVDNMSKGTFRDVQTSLILNMAQGEDGVLRVDARDIKLSLMMDGMDVDYRAPLPALRDASAAAEFLYDDEKLLIHVHSGVIGGLRVDQAELVFDTILQSGKGIMDLKLDLSGDLADMLRYIEMEPIAVEHQFDVEQVKGAGNLSVHLNLPTIPDLLMSQITVNVDGVIEQATLPNILRGLPLTGGPFQVSVDNESAKVTGKGQLAGRNIDVSWMEFLNSEGQLYSGKVTAQLMADQKLREYFGIDLSDFLSGSTWVDLDYTEYQDGSSVADVKVDMKAAQFFVEPFGYKKPAGVNGRGSFRALLQNGEVQEVDHLTVQAQDIALDEGRIVFEGRGENHRLSKGRLGTVRIGESDAAIDFEIAETGETRIWFKGSFLDLRPFLKSDEHREDIGDIPYNKPSLVLSVEADTMRTSNEEVIQHGRIFADINEKGQFNQLEMDAKVGAGDIYLRFKPDATGARTFRFESDDAGATLRAFGVYPNIRGGKMVIYGEPLHGIYDRNLIGLAEITDFRVVKAPALAKLLGAMSLPGMTQILGNEGIVFTKLESNFDWVSRFNGSVLVLKDGRSSGNALGITFDGVFDQQTNIVDVSGTIIPLSTLNKMLGGIPVLGDVLGGAGGLFAATYTMKGEGGNPETTINPLSVLAPGILRRILFE